MRLITFLNSNAGALSLLFSLVVTAATVFYAFLTKRLVRETERMRQAQTEPSVSVRVEPHDEFFHIALLIVENVGAGPAYDVKLSVSPEFEIRPGRKLSDTGMFKHGMRYLAPKQRISQVLASVIDQAAAIEDPAGRFRFQAVATYRDVFGRTHEDIYPLDLLHLVGLLRIGTPALRSIANDLEKIRTSIGHIESGRKRLKVDSFNAQDRQVEQAELEAWLREQDEAGERIAAVTSGSGADTESDAVGGASQNTNPDLASSSSGDLQAGSSCKTDVTVDNPEADPPNHLDSQRN